MGASMAENWDSAPRGRPVSALIIHGTDDPLVPYEGGEVAPQRPGGGRTLPIERVVALWCAVDSIRGAPTETTLPHRSTGGDPTRTTRILYPPGGGGGAGGGARGEGGG